MTAWVVAIPVWGQEFIDKFLKYPLPAIKLALERIVPNSQIRFIVHTDQPDRLREHFAPYPVEFHGIPGGENPHVRLGEINRHSLRLVNVGEAVAFINADMIPSIEAFAAAEARFSEGKKIILCMGTRTLEDSGFCIPPVGAASRDLLKWAWEHRHPWITGCIWGSGNTKAPTVLYFKLNDGVILHAFHLHPFALVKEESHLSFQGVTIDRDLLDQFTYDQIHVVTNADELAFAEMSPSSKNMGTIPQTLTYEYVAGFAKNVATRAHRWTFGHRIEIIGPANDLADVPVVSEILHHIEIHLPMSDERPAHAHYPIGTLQYLSKERQEYLQKQAEMQAAISRRFYICLPAWGERHVQLAREYVVPALLNARMIAPGVDMLFRVYTDHPEAFHELLNTYDCDYRKVNQELPTHEMLNIAHQQVITEAQIGTSIVLMCGDIVPSRELFDYALRTLAGGRKVIATSALRTVITGEGPPVGVTGRELLGWGWRNRHPMADACVWHRSHTSFPNVLFFEDGENVVMHTFHLHPFVMLKDRNPHYKGTVDDDLLNNYEKHEIQFVTDGALGFVEISKEGDKPTYYADSNDPLTVESVAQFAKIMIPSHWRNFNQQVRVIGDGPVCSLDKVEAIQKLVRPSIHHPWPTGG